MRVFPAKRECSMPDMRVFSKKCRLLAADELLSREKLLGILDHEAKNFSFAPHRKWSMFPL